MQTYDITIAVEAFAGSGLDAFRFALFEIFRPVRREKNALLVSSVQPPKELGSTLNEFTLGVLDRAQRWACDKSTDTPALYIGNVSFTVENDESAIIAGFVIPVVHHRGAMIARDFRVGTIVPETFKECIRTLEAAAMKDWPALSISPGDAHLGAEIVEMTCQSVQRALHMMTQTGSA